MPKVPPFATAQVAHQYGPVDSFLLRPNVNSGSSTRAPHANGELRDQVSILDTVFISQRSQRAVYATTSSGAVTSLWRVSTNGALTQIAKIDWDYELPVGQGETSAGGIGDGSLKGGPSSSKPKKASMVTFGGKMVKVDDFLKKGKGWFASESRSFSAEGIEYKWKPSTESIPSENGETEDVGIVNGKSASSGYHQGRKIWKCVTTQQPADKHAARPGGVPQVNEPYPGNTYPASQSAAPASNGHAPSSHQEHSVSLPYMSGTNDDYPVHQSLSTNEHVDTQDLASVSMLSPVDPTVPPYPSPTTPFTAMATSSDPINPPENNAHHQYADRNVQATIYQSTLFKSIIPAPTTSQFLLACLAPLQPTGSPEGELILFPHLFPSWSSSFTHDPSSPTEHQSVPSSSSSKSRDLRMLETVLLTAILLVVNKGEWTRVQSPVDPLALQAVFMAEARGDVPPYTPGPTGMRRLAQRQGGSYPYPRIGTGNSASSPVDAEMADGRTRGRANSGPLERPRINLAEEARLANARYAKSAGDGASHQLSTPPITVQRRQSHRTSHSTPLSAQGPDTNPFPTPPFAFPLRGVGSRRGAGRPSVDGHGNNSTGIRIAPTTSSGHSRAGDGFFTSRRPSTSHGRARDTAIESRPPGNQDLNETVSRNRTITRALDFTGSRSTRSRPSSSGGRRPSTTEVRAGDGFFSTSRRTVVPSNDRESTRPATATLLNLSYSQDAPIPPTRSPPPDYEQFATAEFKDGGIKG